jgi:hypothetical protein
MKGHKTPHVRKHDAAAIADSVVRAADEMRIAQRFSAGSKVMG